MTTSYTITAKGKPDVFSDNVSLGDAVTYDFDFTPWQEDNDTITSVTWSIEQGSVAVSDKTLSNGIASALLTFSQSGRSLISITANTGSEKKRAWLEVNAKNLENNFNQDYGIS